MLIYPPNNHQTTSSNIFFIGSARNFCTIQNNSVALFENGNFAHTLNLNLGVNPIDINIDGENFTREIIVSASPTLSPLAYAYPYPYYANQESQDRYSLESIIVRPNRIDFHSGNIKPEIFILNPQTLILKASDNLKNNLNWIHYRDETYKLINIVPKSQDEYQINFALPCSFQELKQSKIENSKFWSCDYSPQDNNIVPTNIIHSNNIPKTHIICLDPGHGGSQSGTVSPQGLQEKTLNLQFAQLLAQKLQDNNINCFLTRNEDQEISLAERVEQAKLNSATMFISIHHNALPDGRDPILEQGISTHYYHENARLLASQLLENLTSLTSLKSAGLYRQDLFVLRELPNIPSVLIELGFLIHPTESEIISSIEFQEQASEAILRLILAIHHEE